MRMMVRLQFVAYSAWVASHSPEDLWMPFSTRSSYRESFHRPQSRLNGLETSKTFVELRLKLNCIASGGFPG
jgi:hypothetical protein